MKINNKTETITANGGAVDIANTTLIDGSTNASIDWDSRILKDASGNAVLTYTDANRPSIAYTPARPDQWDVSIPENIVEAVDRLAEYLFVLNSNSPIPQATLEAPVNDSIDCIINGSNIEISGYVQVNASYGTYTVSWYYSDATGNNDIGDVATVPVGGLTQISASFPYTTDPTGLDWDLDVYVSGTNYNDSSTTNIGATYP